MKAFLFLPCFLLFSHTALANFDFANSWLGDKSDFASQNADTINLAADKNKTLAAIYTPLGAADEVAQWNITVDLDFKPSTSNYARFFALTSSDCQRGVAVRVEKNAILEFVSDGKSVSSVKSVSEFSASANKCVIQLTRTVFEGEKYRFEAVVDCNGTPETLTLDLTPEQVAGLDFAAIWCRYTTTRIKAMHFSGYAITTGFEPIKPIEISAATARGSVVISELMPIQSDLLGLPDAEFIEIRNTTAANFNLKDWVISNGKINGKLPEYILKSDSCITLCIKTRAAEFAAQGIKIISPSAWPTITNASCRLILKNSEGLIIDAIDYNQAIFGNTPQKDGGYSVERIDCLNLSERATNWAISSAALGGTPSAENTAASPNPDKDLPQLQRIDIDQTGSLLLLYFDEPMDTTAIASNFKIDGAAVAAKCTSLDSIMFKSFAFELSKPLILSEVHNVEVPHFTDLAGNASEQQTVQVAVGEAAKKGDIVLNEIMFAAKPSSGDYVEIFNTTDKALDLSTLSLGIYKEGELTTLLPVSAGKRLIFAGEYFVLCADSNAVVNAYGIDEPRKVVQINKLPALADDKGTIALASPTGEVWERLDWAKQMYGASFGSIENVSLERVDTTQPIDSVGNWGAATASNNFATPTRANSTDRPEPEPPIEISAATARGSVVISELMPIQSDLLGLPDAEFIEIRNTTAANFNLKDWVISNGKINGKLPEYILKSDSCITLCIKTRAAEFAAQGIKTISPSAWPTITNASCRLILKNAEGLIIDAIDYNQAIFGNTPQKDGGYSVERIDCLNLSERATNWAISSAALGGTPSAENTAASPNPDKDLPQLQRIDIDQTGSLLLLYFDEPMDTTAIASNFKIDGAAVAAKCTSLDSIMFKSFAFELSKPLILSEVHNVEVPHFTDLAGNASEQQTVQVAVGEAAKKGDIVLNEIMFAAKPSSGDYVEIFNTTDKALDLSTLSLGIYKEGELTTLLPVSAGKRLIFAGEYFVLCADSNAVVNAYGIDEPRKVVQINKLPALADDKGTIALASPTGEVWERLDWAKQMYGASFGSIENVSLERIDTTQPIDSVGNWGAATASNNFATPTRANSTDRPEPEPPIEISTATARGSVVISELMPIQSDLLGLPDAEFIEIRNTTAANFNLKDWVISNGKINGKLPEYILKSDSCITLCIKTRAAEFAAQGIKIISPSAWPTITNASCRLILKNAEGLIIDAIDYNQAIFGNTPQKDGGYSVERIDCLNLSERATNWAISSAALGGTPSAENTAASPNPDQDLPQLQRIDIDQTGSLLLLYFDEPMDTTAIASNFKIDGAAVAAKCTSLDSIMFKSFAFELSKPLTLSEVHNVEVPHFTDLAGNDSEQQTVQVAVGEAAQKGDIVLNEIMFAAKPSSGDYVEIFNTTDKALDLSTLSLGIYKEGELTTLLPVSAGKRLIFAGEYFVLCADSNAVVNAYGIDEPRKVVQINKLPALADDKGTIALASPTGEVWERLDWAKQMYGASFGSIENVSLERISVFAPAGAANNWAGAAEGSDYATPTRPNGQNRDGAEAVESDLEMTQRIFSPDGDGIEDEMIIRTRFTEGLWTATMRIFATSGQLVAVPLNNEQLPVSGELRWNGRNESGDKMSPGTYIVHIKLWQDGGRTMEYKRTCVLAVTSRP